MKNDPDIIRWSQLKRILIHFLGWAFVYFIFGLGFGFTDKFFYKYTWRRRLEHCLDMVSIVSNLHSNITHKKLRLMTT